LIILFTLVVLFFRSERRAVILRSLSIDLVIVVAIVIYNWAYTQRVITSPVQKINSTLDNVPTGDISTMV